MYQNLPVSVIPLRTEEQLTALLTILKSSDKDFKIVSARLELYIIAWSQCNLMKIYHILAVPAECGDETKSNMYVVMTEKAFTYSA